MHLLLRAIAWAGARGKERRVCVVMGREAHYYNYIRGIVVVVTLFSIMFVKYCCIVFVECIGVV